jgi:hypothetical protein
MYSRLNRLMLALTVGLFRLTRHAQEKPNYFRVADHPEVIRPVLRQTVHPPYRRASFRHRA